VRQFEVETSRLKARTKGADEDALVALIAEQQELVAALMLLSLESFAEPLLDELTLKVPSNAAAMLAETLAKPKGGVE
jgi:hypothetical protein